MEWIQRLNQAVNYIEENLSQNRLLLNLSLSKDVFIHCRYTAFRVYPQAPHDRSRI